MNAIDQASVPEPTHPTPSGGGNSLLQRVLIRLQIILDIPPTTTRSYWANLQESRGRDDVQLLVEAGDQAGIFLKELESLSAEDVIGFVRNGYPVLLAEASGDMLLLERVVGRKLEGSEINSAVNTHTFSKRQLRRRLESEPPPRCLVAKQELECDRMSATPAGVEREDHQHHDHHHHHPPPLRRFLTLLNMDRRDVMTVFLFASVAGVLALASPLAVESLVNVVSWGTYIQPLLILASMLLISLGLAGVLGVLQTVVVEMVQRRQFVRIVSDLAHRFPRANQRALAGIFPRELANRIFDIMTIQKATAVLLIDGVSIVLTTIIGMVLLAFYHPFLLGFDLVLVFSMISITWILGRGGIRTAIDESITKYKVAHWLQDVIAQPAAFKTGGGEGLAVDRANQLTAEYIAAREKQFRVIIRQIAFAISLQVIASTVLLGLGGWLVIQGQLTLGQLVASELVVTVVVGAFAKAGKSLEKFYDLMAGIDKVGHLLDVPVDPRLNLGELPNAPADVRWGNLRFQSAASSITVPAAAIAPGSSVAITGDHCEGRTLLARTLAGLVQADQGVAEINSFEASQAAAAGGGRLVAYAGRTADLFRGTLRENIDLGRAGIGPNRVREALQKAGLWRTLQQLHDGLDTMLQTGGHPLGAAQCQQVMLARAFAGAPKLLVIDGLLDTLNPETRAIVLKTLLAEDAPWTLVIVTDLVAVIEACDSQISVHTGGAP